MYLSKFWKFEILCRPSKQSIWKIQATLAKLNFQLSMSTGNAIKVFDARGSKRCRGCPRNIFFGPLVFLYTINRDDQLLCYSKQASIYIQFAVKLKNK